MVLASFHIFKAYVYLYLKSLTIKHYFKNKNITEYIFLLSRYAFLTETQSPGIFNTQDSFKEICPLPFLIYSIFIIFIIKI